MICENDINAEGKEKIKEVLVLGNLSAKLNTSVCNSEAREMYLFV